MRRNSNRMLISVGMETLLADIWKAANKEGSTSKVSHARFVWDNKLQANRQAEL